MKDPYGYIDAHAVKFGDLNRLKDYLRDIYDGKINYKKIKFDNPPDKIVLVIADNEPKDIFSYYKKGKSIGRECINLRKYNKKLFL